MKMIEYLIKTDYIQQSGNVYVLTPKADDFIKNHRTMLMQKAKDRLVEHKPVAVTYSEEPELMTKLRELRKSIASKMGVPAYVVFTDESLRDMCRKRPSSLRDFLNVSGVGSVKAERYGRKFIAVLSEYDEKT